MCGEGGVIRFSTALQAWLMQNGSRREAITERDRNHNGGLFLAGRSHI